ncbi:MAG TPA: hypothetical protein VFP58_12420 [Candidatus Eisenbacteria bacterium]|nr:hypothetical protein [Candidatus Eisenbacteria bacterium]
MAPSEYPRARARKPYAPEPGQPVQVQAGDIVYIGEESPVYPGWVRIRVPDGRKTWAPDPYVRGREGEEGRVLVDYDARELAVETGTLVTMLLELRGWTWVRTDDGREGWLPLETLEILSGEPPQRGEPPETPATVISPIRT